MTAPVSCETGARVSFRTAVELCAFVDRLSSDDAGELHVFRNDGDVHGTVFVERGRVCWAAARGLAPRLSQLLGEAARVAPDRLAQLVLQCRQEGRPLGEVFVERGGVPAEDLRRTLFQHSVESLQHLCSTETQGAWRAKRKTYSPRFTFDTSELLARAVARVHGAYAEPSASALAAFSSLRTGEWGAAFLRIPSLAAPLPIAVTGTWPERSLTLMKVGKWAASTLDVSRIFQDEDALVSTFEGGEGGSLVAWRSGELLIVGRLLSQGPARILNYRAMARRRERASE